MDAQHSMTVTAADEQRPSMAVVSLVATVTDTDPLELEPLYDAVDPEALDSLCTPTNGVSSLSFEYAGYTVVVERADDGIDISLESVTVGLESARGVADSGPSA
ncbi:HalOD1 output domain-containing protein [Natronorubrum aibiense]|nr:HalOD1 output domain-containing protein [Natronorubrum aibiense]